MSRAEKSLAFLLLQNAGPRPGGGGPVQMSAQNVPQLVAEQDHLLMLGQVFLQEHDPQICVLVGEGRQPEA